MAQYKHIAVSVLVLATIGLDVFAEPTTGTTPLAVNEGQTDRLTGNVKSFLVLDATLYKNKPNLAVHRIKPLHVVYGHKFWNDTKPMDNLPAETTTKQLARDAVLQAGETGLTCIDIEHWPLHGDSQVVAQSTAKYIQIAKWFHAISPTLKIGYYGNLPLRDYWRAIKGTNDRKYREWQTENDRIKAIASAVDVLFPSLYTFYPDKNGWEKYAVAQIREARRFNKPIYVFLWPQYHDSNRFLRGKYISADFWRFQLETAHKYADGIVIWGGWADNGPAEWDENAPWWGVTKTFMERLQPVTNISTNNGV